MSHYTGASAEFTSTCLQSVPLSNHDIDSLKLLYFSRIFWGVATSCVRLSILCLFYRLLDRCQGPKSMRLVLHGTTIFTTALLLAYLGTGIIPCM
jgi:hypothetical protein